MKRRTFFAAFVAPAMGLFGWRPRKDKGAAKLKIEFPVDGLAVAFEVEGNDQVGLDYSESFVKSLQRDVGEGWPVAIQVVFIPGERRLQIKHMLDFREWEYADPKTQPTPVIDPIRPDEIVFAPDPSEIGYRKFMIDEDLHGDPR